MLDSLPASYQPFSPHSVFPLAASCSQKKLLTGADSAATGQRSGFCEQPCHEHRFQKCTINHEKWKPVAVFDVAKEINIMARINT